MVSHHFRSRHKNWYLTGKSDFFPRGLDKKTNGIAEDFQPYFNSKTAKYKSLAVVAVADLLLLCLNNRRFMFYMYPVDPNLFWLIDNDKFGSREVSVVHIPAQL